MITMSDWRQCAVVNILHVRQRCFLHRGTAAAVQGDASSIVIDAPMEAPSKPLCDQIPVDFATLHGWYVRST